METTAKDASPDLHLRTWCHALEIQIQHLALTQTPSPNRRASKRKRELKTDSIYTNYDENLTEEEFLEQYDDSAANPTDEELLEDRIVEHASAANWESPAVTARCHCRTTPSQREVPIIRF